MKAEDVDDLEKMVHGYRNKRWDEGAIARIIREEARERRNPHPPTEEEIEDLLKDFGLPLDA